MDILHNLSPSIKNYLKLSKANVLILAKGKVLGFFVFSFSSKRFFSMQEKQYLTLTDSPRHEGAFICRFYISPKISYSLAKFAVTYL